MSSYGRAHRRRQERAEARRTPANVIRDLALIQAIQNGCTCVAEPDLVFIEHRPGIAHVQVRHDPGCPAIVGRTQAIVWPKDAA